MSVLAVIPARGGSKGVPRKNIRNVNGKPLITYSIEATLKCRHLFHDVIVSTDDEAIAKVANNVGANVPFIRPVELATDEATSLSVMQHAVCEIEKADNVRFDWVLLIQATNPFVEAVDIEGVVKAAYSDAQATSVVSVQSVIDYHPMKLKTIRDGYLTSFKTDGNEADRRQDLPPIYKRNGSLYMTRRDVLMEGNDLYGCKILPYEMPPERSIDIDKEQDLEFASFLFARRN